MANSYDKWFKRNRLVVTLIPAVFFLAAIFIVQFDKKPEVVHHAAIERPGYEPAPETYYVEASPHKKWADYWAGNWFLVVLGFVVSVGGTFAYITYVEKEVKQGSWVPIGVAWLGGALLIFLGYVLRHGAMEYFTTLTPADFEAMKDNLDGLFPLKK